MEAEKLAWNATKGPKNADSMMLGRYEGNLPTSYHKMAQEYGDQYFQLDNWDELASIYSDEDMWKINKKFLDIQISSGREIYLSHDPIDNLKEISFYQRELQYLQEHGYGFIQEGDLWHAVKVK